jgi:diguanylate cyclase (GGDEF)-like protein
MIAPIDDRRARTGEDLPLRRRIFQLERELATGRDENALLSAVLETATALVAERDAENVPKLLLAAMHEKLGFSRAVYFAVDRSRGIEPRWQIDGPGGVEPSFEMLDTDPRGTVFGVLRGEPDAVGSSGELSAPIVGVRGWYVLSSLAGSDGAIGILYVDGHRSPEPQACQIDLVRALTTAAAKAIENARLLARTRELATRDSLTSLLNVRAFDEQLEAIVASARERNASFAFVTVDVDDFKTINDRFGHSHGDDVLRRVARTLTESSRREDAIARPGGDEFAVVIVDVDSSVARSRVARLSADLQRGGLRCSLGAALFPGDAQSIRELRDAADTALYNTKAAGKNGFSFY